MSDITKKNLTELVNLIKNKKLSSEELTQSFIKNINNDKKLNSFITNCSDQALNKAKNFDKKPNLDTLLPGIPIAVARPNHPAANPINTNPTIPKIPRLFIFLIFFSFST